MLKAEYHAQVLTTLAHDGETIKLTYHWNRSDPDRLCAELLKVLKNKLPIKEDLEQQLQQLLKQLGEAETAETTASEDEVANLKANKMILHGPWSSHQQARESLSGVMKSSFPEFHRTFTHCRECFF